MNAGDCMNSIPLISCIMAVYNTQEIYLRAAIESVLQQSFADYEFIIIDDYSNFETIEVLNSYSDIRIKRLRNEKNLGLTISLNKCISIAKGKYIARMDADDICDIKRFEYQIKYMEKDPSVIVLGTRAIRFEGEEGILGIYSNNSEEIKAHLFFGNVINHPSVFIRKDFLIANNLLYDKNIKKAQDYDLWTKIIQLGEIKILSQCLIKYRIHHTQISQINNHEQNEFANNIKIEQVKALVGELNEYEKKIHLSLCEEKLIANYQDTILWVEKLICANTKKELINPYYFNRIIMRKLVVSLIKFAIIHKKIPKFKCKFIVKILNPYYYYEYLKFIFGFFENAFIKNKYN